MTKFIGMFLAALLLVTSSQVQSAEQEVAKSQVAPTLSVQGNRQLLLRPRFRRQSLGYERNLVTAALKRYKIYIVNMSNVVTKVDGRFFNYIDVVVNIKL